MSERVLNQAVYSLIKELEVQTDRRVKGEARCKCEHGCRARCEGQSVSVRQGHKVRYVLWGVFCLSFLSVCTGDISTKAMVGVDIAVLAL